MAKFERKMIPDIHRTYHGRENDSTPRKARSKDAISLYNQKSGGMAIVFSMDPNVCFSKSYFSDQQI
jgi:hypothetical protein